MADVPRSYAEFRQIVGRVVRFNSHVTLPEIDRQVNVRMFVAQFPTKKVTVKSSSNTCSNATSKSGSKNVSNSTKSNGATASASNQQFVENFVDSSEESPAPTRRRASVSGANDPSFFSRYFDPLLSKAVSHVSKTIGLGGASAIRGRSKAKPRRTSAPPKRNPAKVSEKFEK